MFMNMVAFKIKNSPWESSPVAYFIPHQRPTIFFFFEGTLILLLCLSIYHLCVSLKTYCLVLEKQV